MKCVYEYDDDDATLLQFSVFVQKSLFGPRSIFHSSDYFISMFMFDVHHVIVMMMSYY